MTDDTPWQPKPLDVDLSDVEFTPTTSEAGPILLVALTVTNRSDEAVDEGRLVLSAEGHSPNSESAAALWIPCQALEAGRDNAYLGGQMQIDPGDWQVRAQVFDQYTNATLKDSDWRPVSMAGHVAHQAVFDDSRPHLMSIFIDSAELIGLECRVHYTVTNATDQLVPAGMRVSGTLMGDAGGESSEAYHYTQALPPYQPEQRYLTLALTDLMAGGGATATATIVVDPGGPSEVYDEVTLTFHGTGPVAVSR